MIGRLAALLLVVSPAPADEPGVKAGTGTPLPPRVGEILRSEPLEEFERTHYPLLIFAPSRVDAGYREQMNRVAKEADGISKRGVVAVSLFADQGGVVGDQTIDMADTAKLRRKYKVEIDQITVILVGKDGVEMSRDRGPVDLDAIFHRIDSPPKSGEKRPRSEDRGRSARPARSGSEARGG